MSDFQQQRVYDWESTLPTGGLIKIENAQSIINHVWAAERLEYPPQVELIHHNTTRWAGQANRLTIWLQPVVTLRTILHEMAHSMTMELDGMGHQHNSWFVGVYAKLVEKYLNVSMPVMLYTASKFNVQLDVMAYPIFLDD